jgi:hypothetical protein
MKHYFVEVFGSNDAMQIPKTAEFADREKAELFAIESAKASPIGIARLHSEQLVIDSDELGKWERWEETSDPTIEFDHTGVRYEI